MEASVKYIKIFLTILIAFVGVVTHAFVASSTVAVRLESVGAAVGIAPEPGPVSAVPIRLYNSQLRRVPGNGVYTHRVDFVGEDGEPIAQVHSLLRAVGFALMPNQEVWGVFMPFPFLIPFVIHLLLVWFVPVGFRWLGYRSREYKPARSFGHHLLVSAVYGYFIMVLFQSTRMVWGSGMWAPGAYLNSHRYGWVSLYVLIGLSVLVYLYCVVGVARLRVRRVLPEQGCIRCGFSGEGAHERCPECGLAAGAWVDSKLRMRPWLLASMGAVLFFSPVLVASVYSVLGLA